MVLVPPLPVASGAIAMVVEMMLESRQWPLGVFGNKKSFPFVSQTNVRKAEAEAS